MSAPNTNLEKQERRHAGPLGGMGLAIAFVAILLIGLISWTVWQGGEPEGAELQVDGRLGTVEASE